MRYLPLVLLLAMVALAGCSPKIVEKIVKQTDTTYVDRLRVDSLFQKDSIFIHEKGDTVYIYQEKIRDRYRLLRDTTYISKHDTTFVDRPIEVERPLTWWQSTRINAFWWLVAGLVLSLLWIFRKPLLTILKL